MISFISLELEKEENDFLSLERCNLAKLSKSLVNSLKVNLNNEARMDIILEFITKKGLSQGRINLEDRLVLQANINYTDHDNYYKGSLARVANDIKDIQAFVSFLTTFVPNDSNKGNGGRIDRKAIVI